MTNGCGNPVGYSSLSFIFVTEWERLWLYMHLVLKGHESHRVLDDVTWTYIHMYLYGWFSFFFSLRTLDTQSAYAYISEVSDLPFTYHWKCFAQVGGHKGKPCSVVLCLLHHFSSSTYCRVWKRFAWPSLIECLSQLWLLLYTQMAQT